MVLDVHILNLYYLKLIATYAIDHMVKKRFKPLAFIDKFSDMPDEKEILFSVRSVFKVESIQQSDNRIWHIVLKLVKAKHQSPDFVSIILNTEDTLAYITNFFCHDVDDPLEKAYIATVIYELFVNIREAAIFYFHMSIVCYFAEDYRTQLKIY
ncbi:unnamed protein product [Didymodactylos carnosus]|uniref:Uncharacterized protein n=1 Tax=Didymodactylos carnosus TaxID=1234261 RepID=A0A813PHG3_9BILA|nr:unnamed protein product [Didymodactylos carnosus]CAF1202678.1 unnamed protein product [Didymodactylos carnosus]CAF3530085.1 unnamed protein product [Didymodactylos carnosus]CAF4012403.1 unnamed protein product [Didymodactylos carnosus]